VTQLLGFKIQYALKVGKIAADGFPEGGAGEKS